MINYKWLVVDGYMTAELFEAIDAGMEELGDLPGGLTQDETHITEYACHRLSWSYDWQTSTLRCDVLAQSKQLTTINSEGEIV